MAVNMIARQAVAPAALTITRHNRLRLAPLHTARPQAPTVMQALAQQDASESRAPKARPDGADTPAERSWLGTPRSIRLPRVTLPQMGTPHWTLKVPTLPVGELAELYAGAAQLLTLWNGPNVEDIRRFEGDTTEPYSYGWFQTLLTETALTNSHDSRQRFLNLFSEHGSPKLDDEWSALEYFCMKTAYLKLRVGDRHRFCCEDYGWQTVSASIRDLNTGLVAHVLTPDDALQETLPQGAPLAAAAPKSPVLIVFRGTARVSNQPEAELGERPTGCQADLDWDGIGFHAFAANQEALLALVRRYMAQGHRVVLAGHSLGGVFAARAMCALTPDEQKLARLRSFGASGLDVATRAHGVVPENNVMVRHRDDKLPRAGGELLDGTLVVTEPQNEVEALYPHGMPLLAANKLNGRMPKYTIKTTEAADMSRTLELGRKFLCLIAHDRVEI